MTDQNNMMESLENIKRLGGFLKSDMSVAEPFDGKRTLKITIQNSAPSRSDDGKVVFIGVGLTIIDGRVKGIPEKNLQPRKLRPTDQIEERNKYGQGYWIAGESFPEDTSYELSYGEMLYPGESLVYELDFPVEALPYLEIRVEGSVSRRHLFHLSRSMEIMKKWRQPLVIETFRALEKIDFFMPLIAFANAVPPFGSQTTFADIDNLKTEMEIGRSHIKSVITEMNKVYNSAPNQKLREYMRECIGQYLKSAGMSFDVVQKALSTGDMEKMKQAVDEMKRKLLNTEEVNRKRGELIATFGIDS